MEAIWQRARPALITFGHVVGAAFIAYLFLVVLMTASLQARVAESLGKLSPSLDYSEGYTMSVKDRGLDATIAGLKGDLRGFNKGAEEARRQKEDAYDDYLVLEAPLRALAQRLDSIPGCTIDLSKTNPEDIARALVQIRLCALEHPLPAALDKEARDVLAGSSKLMATDRDYLRYWRYQSRFEAAVERTNAQITAAQQEQKEFAPARKPFDAMSALRQRWMIGGDALIELPPAITQILLAFVAGMFGALLLTLVLVVYPKSGLKLSSSEGGYGPRILLGGLIAVCVLVVVGGGTAVLGTTNAFVDGEANFMAFCAIAILAGMFSDQVAAWLWDRADAFFKKSKQEGEGGEEGGEPAEPPAGDGKQPVVAPPPAGQKV